MGNVGFAKEESSREFADATSSTLEEAIDALRRGRTNDTKTLLRLLESKNWTAKELKGGFDAILYRIYREKNSREKILEDERDDIFSGQVYDPQGTIYAPETAVHLLFKSIEKHALTHPHFAVSAFRLLQRSLCNRKALEVALRKDNIVTDLVEMLVNAKDSLNAKESWTADAYSFASLTIARLFMGFFHKFPDESLTDVKDFARRNIAPDFPITHLKQYLTVLCRINEAFACKGLLIMSSFCALRSVQHSDKSRKTIIMSDKRIQALVVRALSQTSISKYCLQFLVSNVRCMRANKVIVGEKLGGMGRLVEYVSNIDDAATMLPAIRLIMFLCKRCPNMKQVANEAGADKIVVRAMGTRFRHGAHILTRLAYDKILLFAFFRRGGFNALVKFVEFYSCIGLGAVRCVGRIMCHLTTHSKSSVREFAGDETAAHLIEMKSFVRMYKTDLKYADALIPLGLRCLSTLFLGTPSTHVVDVADLQRDGTAKKTECLNATLIRPVMRSLEMFKRDPEVLLRGLKCARVLLKRIDPTVRVELCRRAFGIVRFALENADELLSSKRESFGKNRRGRAVENNCNEFLDAVSKFDECTDHLVGEESPHRDFFLKHAEWRRRTPQGKGVFWSALEDARSRLEKRAGDEGKEGSAEGGEDDDDDNEAGGNTRE